MIVDIQPVLWAAAEVTRNRGLERVEVSLRSTVANLLWNDCDSSQLRQLSERMGVPVAYSDTLVEIMERRRSQ